MKKKVLVLSSLVVFILIVGIVTLFYSDDDKVILESGKNNSIVRSNAITMMYETGPDTGEYQVTSDNSWPGDEYVFNETLSKCENGSKIYWDSNTNRVIMEANTADKCYVYFDIYKLVNIENVVATEKTANSITVKVSATSGDGDIATYHYSINGGSYVSSINNTYTFSGLNTGSYTIKVYITDTNGKPSIVFTTDAAILEQVLPHENVAYDYYTRASGYLDFEAPDFDTIYAINFETYPNWQSYFYYDYMTLDFVNNIPTDICSTNPNYCNVYSVNNTAFISGISDVGSGGQSDDYGNIINDELQYIASEKKFYIDGKHLTSQSFTYHYYILQFAKEGMENSNWVIVNISYMCLSENTYLYVYDKKKKRFKKKKIKYIDYGDELLVWDFDNGCFTTAKPLWIKKAQTESRYNLLKFSDGSTLETISQHRIFNVEKGMFTYPMTDDTPIGTTTFNANGEYVKLVSKEYVHKEIKYYNIISNYHINFFANEILTSCRLNNIYPIEDMKFKKDNRKLKKREDYPHISDEWFYGIRIAEQPDNVDHHKSRKYGSIEAYIEEREELRKK